jgi:hypothetical protein
MDELTKMALVGTSQYGGTVPTADHPAFALLAELPENDREELLLLRSGTQAVYDLAGHRPVMNVAAIAPAPTEDCRKASRKLAGLLQNALATNASDLLIGFLQQMQGARIVAPPDLLPLLLDCTDPAVREQVLPILGVRGRWLSTQNPAWSWVQLGAAHVSESDQAALQKTWDDGTIAERCQVVALLRRSNPELAREWVSAIFAQEKPAHRVSLLEEFVTGLSPADEPFLEKCLSDRAPTVGQTAARLLCRLPASALAIRMRDRAAAMLIAETKGSSKKLTKLGCSPPEKIDRDWERDGVPGKAPTGRGLRALWVETVLAAVPPANWSTHFGFSADQLIEAILDDQFEGPVLQGWTEAAARFAATDSQSELWLTPLWNHWAGAVERMKGAGRALALERLKTLLPSMARGEAERGMLNLFTAAADGDHVETLALLSLLPRPWSAEFGTGFLALVRQVLAKRSDNTAYQWANTLFIAGRALPADAFPAALADWVVAEVQKSAAWQVNAVEREIDQFMEVIQTRQGFFAEVVGTAHRT